MRSGLAAQLGIRKEAAYGTFLAPNRFFPFTSESISLTKEYVRSRGLRAGRMAQAQNLHKATTRSGGGNIVLELLDQGMGPIFDLFHGNAVVPAQVAATIAYTQQHAIGLTPPWGKSATVQVGRPSTDGTINPFSYVGCKGLSLEISIEASGIATITLSVDARDEETALALAVATYDADALPFSFNEMLVQFGGVNAANVRSITISLSVPQATNRYHLNNSGVKDQPIANDIVEVTANATLEFASMADHTRFKNEQVVALDLKATGALIVAGHNMEANFKLPAAKQTSSGPTVGGPDVITQQVNFEGLDNGVLAPFIVDLKSTDVTL
jgi:hypothetical protein